MVGFHGLSDVGFLEFDGGRTIVKRSLLVELDSVDGHLSRGRSAGHCPGGD